MRRTLILALAIFAAGCMNESATAPEAVVPATRSASFESFLNFESDGFGTAGSESVSLERDLQSICADVVGWWDDSLYVNIMLTGCNTQQKWQGVAADFYYGGLKPERVKFSLPWHNWGSNCTGATGWASAAPDSNVLRLGGFDACGDYPPSSTVQFCQVVFTGAPGPDWIKNVRTFDDWSGFPTGCFTVVGGQGGTQ